MGLLKHLLFWPVTGPTYLARFSLEKVEGAVKTELTDDSAVKRELMELQMQLELGDIDDDEYVEREAAIMQRFRQVRQWREQFGMATSGGLVRVAGEGEAEADIDDPGEPSEPPPDDRGATEDEPARKPSVARSDEAEIEIVLDFDED